MGAKLTQCPNGHYYDAEQYTSCPYCQSVTSNSFNDTDRVTDSFIPAQGSGYGYGGNGNDDRTMPIDHISERQPMRYTSPTATPTAPLNQCTAAQEAYDEGKTEVDIRSQQEIMIGRSSQYCQIILTEQDISRKHCSIKYEYQGSTSAYYVTDYSTFGVIVNDSQKLEKGVTQRLPKGTKLTLGQGSNEMILG